MGDDSRVQVRFPTLELFAATSGGAFSGAQRPLSKRELDLARPVFRNSIRYQPVRLVQSGIANAPTTLGNFIRVSKSLWSVGLPDRTLIHELMHIWQFQCRGTAYVSNSLYHQVGAMITEGNRSFAYTLTGREIVEAGSIDRLPAEKQAVFVELWFLDRTLEFPGNPNPQPVRSNSVCQAMMKKIRQARPLSADRILDEAAFGPGGPPVHEMWDRDRLSRPTVPLLRIEF